MVPIPGIPNTAQSGDDRARKRTPRSTEQVLEAIRKIIDDDTEIQKIYIFKRDLINLIDLKKYIKSK